MTASFLQAAIFFSFAALTLALLLGLFRLARGPSLPDRVIALDLIATITVGLVGLYCISVNQPAFLDAGLVLALIGFLGTVAFAQYIEKGIFR